MDDDRKNIKSNERLTLGQVVFFMFLAILILAIFYVKEHPQFLESHYGSIALNIACIVIGISLVFFTFKSIRDGSITGGRYVTMTFLRSESPGMFWFLAFTNFSFGFILILIGLSRSFGLISA